MIEPKKCVKCGKPASVVVQNLYACKDCFLKIIEKRVRKEIRVNKLIKKNDKILIIDNSSPEFLVGEYLLKKIIKGLPAEISVKKSPYTIGKEFNGSFNKIIIPWNADMEDEYFLKSIFENKKAAYIGHFSIRGRLYIKPLINVLSREIIEFCKIKGLKANGLNKKKQKSPVFDMLEDLESEYPEIKFSLLKNIKEIASLKNRK